MQPETADYPFGSNAKEKVKTWSLKKVLRNVTFLLLLLLYNHFSIFHSRYFVIDYLIDDNL